MTLEMWLWRVHEVGAAVGELSVVDVLDLSALDGELDPELGRTHDVPHRVKRLLPLAVKRFSGQNGPGLDQSLVETRGEDPPVIPEDRAPCGLLSARRVLGL